MLLVENANLLLCPGVTIRAPDGPRRMANNVLVANMLPIAESKPEDKATMVALVVNLINRDNQPSL